MSDKSRYVVFRVQDSPAGEILMRSLVGFAEEVMSTMEGSLAESAYVDERCPEYQALSNIVELRILKQRAMAQIKGVFALHERASSLMERFRATMSKTENQYLQSLAHGKIVFGTQRQKEKVAELEVKYLGKSREKEHKT